MATRHSLASALAAAALLSTPASGSPVLRASWDDCDPVVTRRDFSGGAVYTQVVSAMGLQSPISSFQLLVRIGGADVPPAWQFIDLCGPPVGCPFNYCQTQGRVSMLLGGTACDTIPGLHVTAHYTYSLTPPWTYLLFTGTADGSFTPDPNRRYTLIRVAFDHSHSVAGLGGTGTCGRAGDPVAFEIGEFTLNGTDQRGRSTWENCLLTWNEPADSPDCPLVVPVKNSTWGRIKTLYR